MKFQLTRTSGRGFTLMELLVVVAIIGMLMSLIIPSLGKARGKANQVTCSTKISNLLLALHTYFAEHNDAFPINGIIQPKSAIPDMYQGQARFTAAEVPVTDKERWRPQFGALWTYMGGISPEPLARPAPPQPYAPETLMKGYLCQLDAPNFARSYDDLTPGNGAITLQDAGSGNLTVTVGPNQGGYFSYSVNSVCNSLGRFRNRFSAGELPWSDPLKRLLVKSDVDFIVFAEEDNASLQNDEVFDAPAYSQGDMLTSRHNGKGNVGFLDRHVEPFSAVVFNEVPSGISGTYVSHKEAMVSPITRKFFPDRGAFSVNAAQ